MCLYVRVKIYISEPYFVVVEIVIIIIDSTSANLTNNLYINHKIYIRQGYVAYDAMLFRIRKKVLLFLLGLLNFKFLCDGVYLFNFVSKC